MTLEQRINSLSQLIATDVKLLVGQDGNLTALTTNAKGNLVAAINEIATKIASLASVSDSTTTTSSTWSSSKINTAINSAITALVAASPTALDTLKELADAINNDPNFAATITSALGNRVRVDAAQTLTATQQVQACANIGIGNPDADFVAIYNAAKNS